MQQFDLWQEWNNYLLDRTEQLNQSITQLCVESNSKFCNLIQDEVTRGIHEWNYLQFQKTMSDWSGWWFGQLTGNVKQPAPETFFFNPAKALCNL